MSDETLLDKLAGDNVELRKQLRQLLGSDNFEIQIQRRPSFLVRPSTEMSAVRRRIEQYSGPKDLLEHLAHDLERGDRRR